MNVKLHIGEVEPLLDNKLPYEMIYKFIKPIAAKANLLFPEKKTGAGYMQWDLPGNDWVSYADFNDDRKPLLAQIYHQRMDIIRSALKGSPIETNVLMVPSDKFIYFRPNGDDWDIAVTAWAYKYPNQAQCGELVTWVVKTDMQDVQIGFKWGGELLPDFMFKLNGLNRFTDNKGLFVMDGKLEVGTPLKVELETGDLFNIVVTKGSKDYIYDLTKYITVVIHAEQDGLPLAGSECVVNYNGVHNVVTDALGTVTLTLPMVCDRSAMLVTPQPECVVSFLDETRSATPVKNGEILDFNFSFKTRQEIPMPQLQTPSPTVDVPPVKREEKVEVAEPKYVTILLLDYGGFPLVDLDFKLTTKKKGVIPLRTNSEGKCVVPQEWFTHKEKMNVNFVITHEYREKHDLHDKKSKRK